MGCRAAHAAGQRDCASPDTADRELPVAFAAQLTAMETGFNTALYNGEIGFNLALTS